MTAVQRTGGVCALCDKPYTPRTVMQKYCSAKCRQRAAGRGGIYYPSIQFDCACCGKTVVTEEHRPGDPGRPDMRRRFCCVSCERRFWKHYDRESVHSADRNTNFRSIREYASYERRTNEI